MHHGHANLISRRSRSHRILSPKVLAAFWNEGKQPWQKLWTVSYLLPRSKAALRYVYIYFFNSASHVPTWTWAGSSTGTGDQTIGCQQQDAAYSSADLRKWLSPLLGRKMAGTMEECEFPCVSIKPSARREGNNTSKDRLRPRLINHRYYCRDIRFRVCTVVEPFMFEKSISHFCHFWLWHGATGLHFLMFQMSDLHLWMHHTATLSSLYQMSLMKNEVTFDWRDILSNTNWDF